MDNRGKSILVTERHTIELEAYGKDRKDAFGAAFADLKKKAYALVDGLIIHMEPEDVYTLVDVEKTKGEKLVGYFKPRQIQNHHVKIQVVVIIKYIPLQS